MTSVNVSETHNTVVVTEQTGTTTTVIVPSESVIVNAIGIGPQGPAGVAGPAGPQGPAGPPGAGGIVVDETNRVNRSIVYFDAGTATYKADAIITDTALTDGGNF